jgi:hypothetical protein
VSKSKSESQESGSRAALIAGAPRREILSSGVAVEHYEPFAKFFVGTAAQLKGYLGNGRGLSANVHRWSEGRVDCYLFRKARSGAEHKATRGDGECDTDFWELRVFDRTYSWNDHLRHAGLA